MIFWCARASALSGCGVWGPGCASDLGLWQANLAQFLHNAEWVQSDTLKTIENTVVPVIQLTTRRLTPVLKFPNHYSILVLLVFFLPPKI